MNNFSNVQQFYSYHSFLRLMEDLVMAGKTTGIYQSAAFINFTKLNLQRILKWDKIFRLHEGNAARLKNIPPQIWWVITEAWCGDAAQTLPVMNKIVEASAGSIDLHIIMRDEHTAIIDQYLTNGGRSIPRLVAIDIDGNELFNWGPRPAIPQKMMMDWKASSGGKSLDDIEREIHLWYAQNKGIDAEQEIMELIKDQ